MMLLDRLLPDRHEPRPGDSMVALHIPVDRTAPRDHVVNAMGRVFACALRGHKLRKILEWDAEDARVTFAVGGEYEPPADPALNGVEIEEWSIHAESTTSVPTRRVRATSKKEIHA
jgi:hypothetical protein